MPVFQKTCDLAQGYHHRRGVQTTVGYLTSLTIGDVTLVADQTVKDPLAPDTDVPVVAVLSDVHWGLGVTDAVHCAGQISIANQRQVARLVYEALTKVDVSFTFAVHAYDPLEKKYFTCLRPTDEGALKGLLDKNGSDLDLSVADDASTDVPSPETYAFQLGIKPVPEAQRLTVATSSFAKVVKPWGLAVRR